MFGLWLVLRGGVGFNDKRRVESNLADNVYKCVSQPTDYLPSPIKITERDIGFWVCRGLMTYSLSINNSILKILTNCLGFKLSFILNF